MGKAARTRRADFRKKLKRSKKEAERQKYASFKEQGLNKKSKRNTLTKQRNGQVKNQRHVMSKCDNYVCTRCTLTDLKKKHPKAKKPWKTSAQKLAFYNREREEMPETKNAEEMRLFVEARLNALDAKLGQGVGAQKERAKLAFVYRKLQQLG